MNERPPEPLAADTVDELLSADLDGAFDAAARDLGMTPADARARLGATPGAAARAAALAAARDAASVAPDPLDDLARRRLLDAARAQARPAPAARRSNRYAQRIVAAGGAVVAVAALIALLFVVVPRGGGGGDDAASSGTAARNAENDLAARPNAPVDSDIRSTAELRAYVAQLLASGSPAPSAGAASGSTTVPSEAQNTKSAREYASAADAVACVPELRAKLQQTGAPRATAAITYQGAPAKLAVFRDDGQTLAVVYVQDGCRVLVSQLTR
jgi:hypothetical protein